MNGVKLFEENFVSEVNCAVTKRQTEMIARKREKKHFKLMSMYNQFICIIKFVTVGF